MIQRFLDVTKIEPAYRHPKIFELFDELESKDMLLLHNDHDPKPLYYQLLGERGNSFSWEYITKGPEIWEVKIRKNEPGMTTETIGEIVAKDIRTAEVFKRHHIDFCCGGKKTIENACLEKGVDILKLKEELQKIRTASMPTQNYDVWSLSFLADYITNIHHTYIKENGEMLKEMSKKVAEHHGKTNSELYIIRDKIDELMAELKVHMKKEEAILFPYVKQLESSAKETLTGFKSVMQPIAVMEHDHDIAGDIIKEINKASNNYIAPEKSCNSFKFLYHKLQEFENDLQLHIHLENNILFPKAIQLEGSLN